MGPVQSHFHLNVSVGLGICHLVLGGDTAPVTTRELYSPVRQIQETRYRHTEEFWKLKTVLGADTVQKQFRRISRQPGERVMVPDGGMAQRG